MTAVINRMFGDNRNFNERFSDIGIQWFPASYLRLWYTNNGSLYMASLAFALGFIPTIRSGQMLPQAWTLEKAWGGEEFPKTMPIME